MIQKDYPERVYAGWLAKIIGIRLGAAVEGWTYERIRELFGELTYYPAEYKNFAADDDSNGPLFFLRALEEKKGDTLTAQDVGEALLNYAPYEHGFFWWGGYGISTEHTAYLNLRRGIRAPMSGSVEQNGAEVAEQIGGQIFIDTWGLVAPGDPKLAAELAEKAASVTHGGNGVYGGMFVAAAISAAFTAKSIREVIQTALAYIPYDCEYARAVLAVMDWHDRHPDSGWRDCFAYVHDNFGYDRYPGACHIIPNICVMILALMYGNGDFDDTLNICNMCGWDTDCNVGNVATIMGVFRGIDAIDTHKWIRPVNDLCIRSGVLGDMNITDIPYGASYIARLGYMLAGEEIPEEWRYPLTDGLNAAHFEYPKSTHAMYVRAEGGPSNTAHLINTDEDAYTGRRSLKFFATRLQAEQKLFLYRKTYYWKDDFSDSRYDPAFSPVLYPGQTVRGALRVPEYGSETRACAYAKDTRAGKTVYGEWTDLEKGQWHELSVTIPPMEGGLIDEAGFCIMCPEEKVKKGYQLVVLADDLRFEGKPDYTVEMANEVMEVWSERHSDITQFSRMKGTAEIGGGVMRVTCEDVGEWYTGSSMWTDYTAETAITPAGGEEQYALVRVQGAIRGYAAGFRRGKLCVMKNDNGYTVLAETPFEAQPGTEYILKVTAAGNRITAACDGISVTAEDTERPWLRGAVGFGVANGSAAGIRRIAVKGL
ncbi:MAG: ADP-ribosylglycohydrolase family protein [Clostridia bacterium]|nr:ADP-ribosylglycohydrolase family protein [Clostridia bacterium]